jgi:SAM-dependent methyltransferase
MVCQDDRMAASGDPFYRHDLAVVHHRGFAHHAAACAPAIVEFLAPVRARRGLVLELGCGTGLLTRELLDAGHRVIATDASPAMLDIARGQVGAAAQEVRQLTLPDDPLPRADAIVAIGHPINYLPDAAAIGADWAIITEFSLPGPDRFVRDITTFVPAADGLWRRVREHHENVLVDTARIPALLGQHGIQARVSSSFGAETLPPGLRAITGHKPAPGA